MRAESDQPSALGPTGPEPRTACGRCGSSDQGARLGEDGPTRQGSPSALRDLDPSPRLPAAPGLSTPTPAASGLIATRLPVLSAVLPTGPAVEWPWRLREIVTAVSDAGMAGSCENTRSPSGGRAASRLGKSCLTPEAWLTTTVEVGGGLAGIAPERTVRNPGIVKRIVRRLKPLGYEVTLAPAA